MRAARLSAGAYWWAGRTYDRGRVFTVNASGQMQAHEAATGAPDWAMLYVRDSPSTGVLAATSGNPDATGTRPGSSVQWRRRVRTGRASQPLAGLASSGGALVVAIGTGLVCFC